MPAPCWCVRVVSAKHAPEAWVQKLELHAAGFGVQKSLDLPKGQRFSFQQRERIVTALESPAFERLCLASENVGDDTLVFYASVLKMCVTHVVEIMKDKQIDLAALNTNVCICECEILQDNTDARQQHITERNKRLWAHPDIYRQLLVLHEFLAWELCLAVGIAMLGNTLTFNELDNILPRFDKAVKRQREWDVGRNTKKS